MNFIVGTVNVNDVMVTINAAKVNTNTYLLV